MQRRGLPHAFSPSIKALGACAMLLALTGCTELARFIGKADPKPEEPVVAEQPTPTQTQERVEGPVEKPKPSKLYEWNGDGRKVSHIVIDTDRQRASFFVGEDEIGWSTVASGLPKHPTPTGKFAVMEKVENKRSNLYGKVVKNGKVVRANAKSGRDPIPAGARFEGAHMPYFMRLTYDGIGLHAGPIPRPGQPASHGCIRLPSTLAPVLFKHVSHGTEVTIVGSGPSYGNYVEKQRVAAARAKREAEQRRIAQANAAQASATSAEVTPVAASTAPAPATARPRADSPSAQQTAATPAAARSPASDAGGPTAGSIGAAPTSAPETSTATAEVRDPSPTTGPTATETQAATSVTTAPAATAPAAATESPERAPQSVAEPVAAPAQTGAETGPAAPPETKPTPAAETAPATTVASPSATPAVTPTPTQQAQTPATPAPAAAAAQTPPPTAAPPPAPAPAAEAPQSPPSSGSAASPASTPAAPAAPPAQAQQAPDAAAPGSDS